MALTKITGQVINDTTGLVVGVTTVGGGLSATDGFFSGIVTAVGDASFSGNVSVGGTLTYEDVTNIDAVGLVTARNGVVVGSGITLSKDGDIFATGITTVSGNVKVGTGITLSPDGDVFFTGVGTGNGSGLTALNASNLASGTVPSARLGSGTASSSTFLAGDSTFKTVTGTTINNNADNRLITGSGTANTLEGESTATYNGTKLLMTGGSGNDGIINMLELKHLNTSTSTGGGTGDGPALLLNGYYSSNEWALAKIAAVNVGGAYGSGYGGGLQFWVHPANGTQTASVIKGAEIIGDGTGANLTINDGNLIIGTAGHGIDFSAQSGTASGMASELLDHYEEGTFTPELSFGNTTTGQSYQAQVGRYTRVGNRCFATCYLYFTNKGSSTGTARIGGLPFTIANISQFYQTGSVWVHNWNGGNTVPTGYGELNTTTFRIERQNASSSSGVYDADHSNFNNNTDMMLSFHYQIE